MYAGSKNKEFCSFCIDDHSPAVSPKYIKVEEVSTGHQEFPASTSVETNTDSFQKDVAEPFESSEGEARASGSISPPPGEKINFKNAFCTTVAPT